MSLGPILWAMKHSPVATPYERMVLMALAEASDTDGCNAYQSKATIARTALMDPKTVQNVLGELRNRGLIAYGNQEAAGWIDERYRPTVYDLMIPYSWFNDIEEINEFRAKHGRPPLTPEMRPDLGPAPERVRRSDQGKPNPSRSSKNRQTDPGYGTSGESDTPLDGNQDEADTYAQNTGEESDTPQPGGNERASQGGMREPARGVSHSPNPPLQTHPYEPSNGSSANAEDPPPSTENGEPDVGKQATEVAKWWWERKQAEGPIVRRGSARPFVSLRDNIIKPGLRAGASQRQVADALIACRDPVPSIQQFQRALRGDLDGHSPRKRRAYDDRATWGDPGGREPPLEQSQAELNDIFGVTQEQVDAISGDVAVGREPRSDPGGRA